MESHEKLARGENNGSQLGLKLGGAALGNHLLGNENSFDITYVHLESHDEYETSGGNTFLPPPSFRITVTCFSLSSLRYFSSRS